MKAGIPTLVCLLACLTVASATEGAPGVGYVVMRHDVFIPDTGDGDLPRVQPGEIYASPRKLNNGWLVVCRDSAGTDRIGYLWNRDEWGRVTASAWPFDSTLEDHTIRVKISLPLKQGFVPLNKGTRYPALGSDAMNYTVRYEFAGVRRIVQVPMTSAMFLTLEEGAEPPPPVEAVEPPPAMEPATPPPVSTTPEVASVAPELVKSEPPDVLPPEPIVAGKPLIVDPGAPGGLVELLKDMENQLLPPETEPPAVEPEPPVEVAVAPPPVGTEPPPVSVEPPPPPNPDIQTVALDPFDSGAGWFRENWGDPGTLTVEDGCLCIEYSMGAAKKFAFSRMFDRPLELASTDVLTIEAEPLNKTQARVALGILAGGIYYETVPTVLKGRTTLKYKLGAKTFKNERTNWQHTAGLEDPIQIDRLTFLVYSVKPGEVLFDNLNLERATVPAPPPPASN